MPEIETRKAGEGKIMVVDDNPSNLVLLEEMLGQKGYVVRSFPGGAMALAAAAKQPPDLILLDINMPELSGYEVCEQLKADTRLAAIPVVFLSALDETEDKVKAFRSGGVDYISKPFQFDEVYARVETQLNLHSLQGALKAQNRHLEEAVASRTRELAEANARLRKLDQAKDDFLRIISHEFRTPLNGLFGVGDILFGELTAFPENNELRQMFERSRERIMSLLDDALLLTQIDLEAMQFRSATVSLSSALNRAIDKASEFARSRHVRIHLVSADLGVIRGDEDLLAGALHALVETAVKFSEQGETIRFTHEPAVGSLRLTIHTSGKTIPSSLIGRFFDVFSISEAITPGGDLGLGPPMACRILSLFGATVAVENQDPAGILLTVAF
jgi:DNA-binding response OmpR family regulator